MFETPIIYIFKLNSCTILNFFSRVIAEVFQFILEHENADNSCVCRLLYCLRKVSLVLSLCKLVIRVLLN